MEYLSKLKKQTNKKQCEILSGEKYAITTYRFYIPMFHLWTEHQWDKMTPPPKKNPQKTKRKREEELRNIKYFLQDISFMYVHHFKTSFKKFFFN